MGCMVKKVLVFILVFFLVVVTVQSASAVINETSQIRSWWTFDNVDTSGSLTIDSNGWRNGTINGATTGASGVLGQAYTFNSAVPDYVNFSYTGFQVGATQNFTLSAWVKPTGSGEDTVINKYYSQGYFMSVDSSSHVYCRLKDGSAHDIKAQGTTNLRDGNFHHIACVFDRTGSLVAYVNGNVEANNTNLVSATGATDTSYDLIVGADTGPSIGAFVPYEGVIDQPVFWNKTLSYAEINTDYNSGAGRTYAYYFSPLPGNVTNFTVTATDVFDGGVVSSFSVELDGVNYTTTTGTLTTGVLDNSSGLFTVKVFNVLDDGGYYNKTYNNVNVSSTLGVELEKLFRLFGVFYTNYTQYSGVNYTRTLNYKFNFTCPNWSSADSFLLVDGVLNRSFTTACIGEPVNVNSVYSPSVEGDFDISVLFNTSYNVPSNNYVTSNQTFRADLNSPSASISYSVGSGFVNSLTQINLTCTDSMSPLVFYNITFNGGQLRNANLSNGTVASNTSMAVDGVNVGLGACTDFYDTSTASFSDTFYVKQLVLIDELNNVPFDVSNITRVRVYFDDNRSYYDFKGNGTNMVNFTSLVDEKLRFDLGYPDDTTIQRYVDVGLLSGDIRVCANKYGVTHYSNYYTSGTLTPIYIKNVFSDCTIGADYTRFAYQDTYLLKTATIDSLYYLYVYSSGGWSLLASIDGSIGTFTNIDTLEFKQTAYNLSIQDEVVSFKRLNTTQVQIYYHNIANDNTALNVLIYRMDNSALVLNTSSIPDPNEVTLYFNPFVFSNVTNTTLFKIEFTKTTAEGVSTINRYFNAQAQSGVLQNGVALVFAVLITVGGLSFVIARSAFGWFGIVVHGASIAVLSSAVGSWQITFMMAVNFILLIFSVLVMTREKQGVVA